MLWGPEQPDQDYGFALNRKVQLKTDLDALMQARGLDALLVTGPALHNPFMVYWTGAVHLSWADLIKKCGQEPVLFHASMERDEAARTGLKTQDLNQYRFWDLHREFKGDMVRATAVRYRNMLADMGITHGKVAVCG